MKTGRIHIVERIQSDNWPGKVEFTVVPNYQDSRLLGRDGANDKRHKPSLVTFDFGELMAEQTELTFGKRVLLSMLPVLVVTAFSLVGQGAVLAYIQGQNSIRMQSMEQQVIDLRTQVQTNYVSKDYFDGSIAVRDEQYREILRRIEDLKSDLKPPR